MYFMGPKLYKNYLQRTFCFPTPRLLRSFIEGIKLLPGINKMVFDTLQLKAEHLKEQNKMIMLSVDEMSIKANLFYHIGQKKVVGFEDFGVERSFKPALNATVVMIRGLFVNWKQPLAYYLVKWKWTINMFKNIEQAIVALQNIGLTVCCVTNDMGSNNIQLANILGVTPEKPYFYVAEQKIAYIFDVPHLLKATRNNLIKHTFWYEDNTISWEYIKTFYLHDKQYMTRSAPKLTDSHITPNNFEKMKVNYASQVFSATVAAGMNIYLRFGQLPASALATIQFVEKMDQVFDVLNL